MQLLDITLPTVPENLALEEALLQRADAGESSTEIIRLWDARERFIVIGRGSRIADEVYLDRAKSANIAVYRRISGGASIVAAPGCLFYAVLISMQKRPQLRMIDRAHEFVMQRISRAIGQLGIRARLDGYCDLVVGNRKVSGNALRVQRNWMLYHGTLLLQMDLNSVDHLLKHPPREPDYRQRRPHRDFLTNLHLDRQQVADALRGAWDATPADPPLPTSMIEELVRSRYDNPAWNERR